MKLPNAEAAVVDIVKLREYSLNPDHPKGKHKARVFLAALGIDENDAEQLREIILRAVLSAGSDRERAFGLWKEIRS
jgi:hypothetical protein